VSLLDDIVAAKRREVDDLRALPRRAGAPAPRDVLGALRRGPEEPLRLIAEVKLRSPSAGRLSRALAPAERACAYAEAGAAMASILCDAPFFDGSWDHLEQAREQLDARGLAIPVLAKEFVVDERQVAEARDRGADAVLLIARIVSAERLAELAAAARDEGVEPMVEVVDEREVEAAAAAGARLVGVNARDLDTLAMDAARAARVLSAVPPDVVAVHLSGLRDPASVTEVARSRADAALMGEALMRQDDPRPLLRAMVDAAGARNSPAAGHPR
jgi:indole-3-glycerol phosphate synthase